MQTKSLIFTPASGADTCIVADSPHSGRFYPPDFNHACSRQSLRQMEDAYVDKLFGFFPALGVPLLQARFPRSYLDLNRRMDEPALLRAHNNDQQCIYTQHPTPRETFNRTARYYTPYYARRSQVLDETRQRHGRYIYLDCHSMFSHARKDSAPHPYDFIIGTLDGQTCAPDIAEHLRSLLEGKGYNAVTNVWFRGQNLIASAGDPAREKHALQIEVNRALYLDEENVRLKPGFLKLKQDLREVMGEFVKTWGKPSFSPSPPKGEREGARAAGRVRGR